MTDAPLRRILLPHFMARRQDGLLAAADASWTVLDPDLPDADDMVRLGAVARALRDAVADALAAGQRPAALCGDCCAAIGAMAGLRAAGVDPSLVWLDAHGDFNTWDTTPSGFIGGMPAAMLTGRGDQTIMAAAGLRPVPDDGVLLSDARDLDPGERTALAASGVVHMADIAELLAHDLPDGPLYVHFDADYLDPADAPAAHRFLAPDGPPFDRVRALFRRLAATGRVVALSVTAWAPELAGAAQSERTIRDLAGELLGEPF